MAASSFLRLPLELRLDIYDFVLRDADEGTVATVLEDGYVSHISGVPDGHRPLLLAGFDEQALSFTRFATQRWRPPKIEDQGNAKILSAARRRPQLKRHGSEFGRSSRSTPVLSRMASLDGLAYQGLDSPTQRETGQSGFGLLVTCRQVREELAHHLAHRSKKGITIHVSYPYGLLVLQHEYPALIPIITDINLCGFHPDSMMQPMKNDTTTPINIHGPQPPSVSPISTRLAMSSMRSLTESCLSFSSCPFFNSFTLRLFFAGPEAYQRSLSQHTPWDILLESGYALQDQSVCSFDEADEDTKELQMTSLHIQNWAWKGDGGACWVMRAARGWVQEGSSTQWPRFEGKDREDWMGVVTGVRDLECELYV